VRYTRHEEIITALGKRIREIRLERGLSQQSLANLCNIELSQINRIELGRVNTSVSHVAVICEVLRIQPRELMNFDITLPPD
jgi:transcriptional regulator with XRE-family HTH domain